MVYRPKKTALITYDEKIRPEEKIMILVTTIKINLRTLKIFRQYVSLIGRVSSLAEVCGIATPVRAYAQDGACTVTTTAAFRACQYGIFDDYLITLGKCVNIKDKAKRGKCNNETKTARNEATKSCRSQQNARQAICKSLGEQRYEPNFDPALFDQNFAKLSISNRYFPLSIGNRWEYGGAETVEIEVLNKTKLIEGVTCIVVNDRVTVNGTLHEDTDDWFAQAKSGDVYYCGEEVKDYETFDGDLPKDPELQTIDGSFKAGRDHAKPGIAFFSAPKKGQDYRQEFSLGNAEDIAEILSTTYAFGKNPELDRLVPQRLAEQLCANGDCVVALEYQPLKPGIFERKYYAPGIGGFLTIHLDTNEVVQLVKCNFDQRCNGLPIP